MYLFFDTETSGLPRNWKAPASNSNNWPRMIQVAWVLASGPDDITINETRLINPNGFEIEHGATRVHGITNEYATEHGVDLLPVLGELAEAIESADAVVAHNLNFDINVVESEYMRASMPLPFAGKQHRCSMEESTDYCQLPGTHGYGFKWPSMGQLHNLLFQESFEGAHDASADCLACMRCFFKLKELQVM